MVFDQNAIEEFSEGELFACKAERITPLVSNPGRVLLTDKRLYFQPFNTVQTAGVEKWKLDGKSNGLQNLQRRRHQLRHTGVELQFGSGPGNREDVFLAFPSNAERESFVGLVCEHSTAVDDAGSDAAKSQLTEVMRKWHRKEISNYEYLLQLNAAAGRSFNDIVQYPVMPWVLADYHSDVLDLDDPATFRDLSKPIGALDEARLAQSLERYAQLEEMNDPNMPPCMWMSHYSTSAYVLYYLVRVAPDYMLRLQSGRFDKPDRLFHSLADTWKGVLDNSMDVKELIPEFYDAGNDSASAFLENHAQLDFGTRQSGESVSNVVLPPWAENAEDCIGQLREALECDYVSAHLHEWVDLIFGFKQQGPAATEAANVFRHFTYEGAVDVRMYRDPLEKASILAQINEFGQTPTQLFESPHPPRTTTGDASEFVLPEFSELAVLESELPEHEVQLGGPEDGGDGGGERLLSAASPDGRPPTTQDRTVAAPLVAPNKVKVKKKRPQWEMVPQEAPGVLGPALQSWLRGGVEGLRCTRTLAFNTGGVGRGTLLLGGTLSASADSLFGTFSDSSLRTFTLAFDRRSGEEADRHQRAHQSRSALLGKLALSSCCLVEEDKLVLAGSWDNYLYLYSMEYGSVTLKKEAHDAAVSAVCMKGDTIVSASWDSLVKVWKLTDTNEPSKAALECQMELAGHESEIACLALSGDMSSNLWAASGGLDGSGIVWCLDTIRTAGIGCIAAHLPAHEGAVTAVAWTDDGCFLASAAKDGTVRLYSVLSTGVGGGALVDALDDDEPTCVDELGQVASFCVMSLHFVGDQLIGVGEQGGIAMWEVRILTCRIQISQINQVPTRVQISRKEGKMDRLEVASGGLGAPGGQSNLCTLTGSLSFPTLTPDSPSCYY